MKNLDAALRFFASSERFGIRLGLERMRSLMARLGGTPQETVYLHIAGTNGKGSVTAFAASALAAAGYRVGVYTSPFLFRFSERIRVLDGVAGLEALVRDDAAGEIPPEAVVRLAARVEQATEDMRAAGEEHPTEFELITAVAFLHFAECRCDAVVLETGLGGRLDATNTIDAPDVCAITALGYDHCDRLGNTMAEIAAEKAAIIKRGTRVVLQDQGSAGTPEDAAVAEAVVRARCREVGAGLRIAHASECTTLRQGLYALDGQPGQVLRFDPPGAVLETALLGSYQPLNALTAYRALEALAETGRLPRLDAAAIVRGFRLTRWPCRFELLAKDPPVLADGAHNPQGAESLRRSLSAVVPGRAVHFVCGVSADKDYPAMLSALLADPDPAAVSAFRPASFRAVAADHPRALSAPALAEAARVAGGSSLRTGSCVRIEDALAEAVREARSDGGAVCAFGSLFLMRGIRSALPRALAIDRPKEVRPGWTG